MTFEEHFGCTPSEHADRDTARIIEVASRDFVTDVDGYQYWWPSGQGHWPPYALRIVATELDRRNAPWDAEVRARLAARDA